MRASEIQRFRPMGSVVLADWCIKGRVPEIACFFNEATGVAYQLWLEAGKFRHTDPLQGQARPYGDWKQLTLE
jgi:hypothetical protein